MKLLELDMSAFRKTI